MEPFAFVIFGVSGNLSQIKLLPAIYDLEAKGLLPEGTKIIGISRQPFSLSDFQNYVADVLNEGNHRHRHKTDPGVIQKLSDRLIYIRGDVSSASESPFPALKKYLDELSLSVPNRLFYFATYPDLYAQILRALKKYRLHEEKSGWSRLMIEKPIGNNLRSAIALNKLLHQYFKEEQIFRLDHYLGKETLQNILVFRFGNSLVGPLMNKDYVDHIQILAAENFGIGSRGGFYDKTGAVKDVGQNHLLQMLVMATMEAPEKLANGAVTKKREEILRSLVPDPKKLVLGQYNGYLFEKDVDPHSNTETFFAYKTMINSKRWAGVPIYVRGGKKLSANMTEIAIIFKPNTNSLFGSLSPTNKPNVLTYRIQPNEGIGFEILTKKPDHKFVLETNFLQYCYRQSKAKPADAYEKLIYDAIAGEGTFFNDASEVEASWQFIDKLLLNKKHPFVYESGSWGPDEANKLIEDDGRKWIDPSPMLCCV